MTHNLSDKKIAIVCDWLTGIGGAERVVLELHKMFPDAPIYTSQYDPSKIDWFKDADVRTGWIQKIPSGLKKFIPVLRSWYFSHLDLSEYDLVISDTGAEAKAVKLEPGTKHVCILNAPTHYYWSRYEQYIDNPGFGAFNWLARMGLKTLVGPLRRWDYKAAQRPTDIVAISSHIQNEIKKYYARESTIIFPPVDLNRFTISKTKNRESFVATGRQTPYKRIDLAVAACTKLSLPLKVIGTGPNHEKLRELAGSSIEFITDASDVDVARHLSTACGFIFAGLDDFGIAPVEALASGTPVIAYRAGGALDYVIPGKTGEFFEAQTVESLCNTLQSFDPAKYSPGDIKRESERFSAENFHKSLRAHIGAVLQ